MKRKLKIKIGKFFSRIYGLFMGLIEEYNKSKFNKIGKNVRICRNGTFTYENIIIGDDVFIGVNAVMQARKSKIIIGNHVAIGPNVNIYGANHDLKTVGVYVSNSAVSPKNDIVIGDDVWVGANSIILPNVRIGNGSVIGAGAVVSKDVPPYTIYTGSPAPKQRERFSEEQIIQHEKLLGENEK